MKYKALIFDLDDTLLDTWGQLVQPAAREACVAMIEAGLHTNLEDCIAVRAEMFVANPKQDLYGALVAHFGVRNGYAPAAIRDVGYEAYFHREVEKGITLFDGAVALLDRLHGQAELFLVTSGHPDTQRQKVAILDISHRFRGVHYVHTKQGETKKTAFRQIIQDTGHQPVHHLSIGDRLDREIRDANALGMHTCHVHYGEFRHLRPSGPEEAPHYRIRHIADLEQHLFH